MKNEGYGKNSKQYREKWINYINPTLDKSPLSEDEVDELFKKYYDNGSSWASIAKIMKTRSENFLKNNFHKKVRKIINHLNKEIQLECRQKNCKPPKELNKNTLEKLSLKMSLPMNKIRFSNIEERIKEIKSLVKERVRTKKKQEPQDNNDFKSKKNHYSLISKENDSEQDILYEVQTFDENLKIRLVQILEKTIIQNNLLLNMRKQTSNERIRSTKDTIPSFPLQTQQI